MGSTAFQEALDMGRCWLMKIAITISRVLGITYKAES
jgi:hypothetical protein